MIDGLVHAGRSVKRGDLGPDGCQGRSRRCGTGRPFTGTSIRYLAKEDCQLRWVGGFAVRKAISSCRYACVARKIRKITLFDAVREIIPPFVERTAPGASGSHYRGGPIRRVSRQKRPDIVITATDGQEAGPFRTTPELFQGQASRRPSVHFSRMSGNIRTPSLRCWRRSGSTLTSPRRESGETTGAPARGKTEGRAARGRWGFHPIRSSTRKGRLRATTFFKTVGHGAVRSHNRATSPTGMPPARGVGHSTLAAWFWGGHDGARAAEVRTIGSFGLTSAIS